MLYNKIIKIIVSLSLCVLFSALLTYAKIPASWLLGSTFVSIILSILKFNITPNFHARSFFSIIIGLTIANSMDSNAFHLIYSWYDSLLLLMLSVIIMWTVNFFNYRKQKYDVNTSLLSSLPGGISTTLLLLDSLSCNRNVVVLSQICRYLITIFLFPLFFFLFYQLEGKQAIEIHEPSFSIHSLLAQFALITIIFIALLIVRKFYKITPIIFALMIGILIYPTDLVNIHIDSTVKIIAQIFIGWLSGSQISLSKASFKETKKIIGIAIKSTLIASIICLIFSLIGKYLFNLNIMNNLLALAPGGSDAMIFLSISFGLDVVFVGAHQVIRIVFINFLVVFVSKHLIKKEKNKIQM